MPTELLLQRDNQPTFEIAGRRVPDSHIIYAGGTQGPRAAPTAGRIMPAGSVPTVGELPTGQAVGTVYHVAANNHLYTFNGTVWQDIGSINNTGVQSTDGSVTNILSMTQAEFNAITPNPSTMYIIV